MCKVFGDWQQDCVKMGSPITKETIIKTVSKLELNSELQLTGPHALPPFLATTLNLPHYMDETTISAHLAESTTSPRKTLPPLRPQSPGQGPP